MKAKVAYKIIEAEENSSSAYSADADSMNVMPYMKTVYLVDATKGFSLKPNSKASSNFVTKEFVKNYEIYEVKLSEMFLDLTDVADFLKNRTILVIPVPETVDIDSLMTPIVIDGKISYIVNLTERELSSALDNLQRRLSKERMIDTYILDKKNFNFNEVNAIKTIDENLKFDASENDFYNPKSFVRMFVRDIHEKMFTGISSSVEDGDQFFGYLGSGGISLNSSFFANSVDNAYVNKSLVTPKLLYKNFIGNEKFDRVDLRGKIFMLLLGIFFEDSDKQTAKNGRFIPYILYTNCDENMIEDLDYSVTDKDVRLSVYQNADEDDGGIEGVKISWTRSCNKNKKELEGVLGIETVMALVVLEKNFMKAATRRYKGISTDNIMSLSMDLNSFMENIKKYDKVKEAYVKNVESTTSSTGVVLRITNYFKVKTETAGLEIVIEKIV